MYSTLTSPDRLNSMFLSADTISLTETEIDRAIAISQRSSVEAQWQQYVNVLARVGMEKWLQTRAPELQLGGRAIQPSTEQACQLQIGNYRVFLIATDGLEAIEVPISRSAIEADFVPHLYVLIEVLEELGQIQVHSAIQQSQLMQQLQLMQPDGETYWLNTEWFDANPDRLLLWLRCLDANAMPTVAHRSIASSITQGAINIGLWLSDRLDQAAQELSWVLLPAPTPSWEFRSMRSPIEEFNHVFTQLTQQNRINPLPQARGGYRDFQWEDAALRLFAITWKTTNSDWTLLLILGAQTGSTLPIGTRLQVRDADQTLAEPVLRDRNQDYLFAQVIGAESECFWVSIEFANGTTLTLPPFTFTDETAS